MLIPFESMPHHARVWVYQANRAFTAAEEQWLHKALAQFCQQWVAHQVPLHASYSLGYHQFVVLAVDEEANGASGCSIDASVHAIQSMQQALGLDFFDRTQLAFLVEGAVVCYPLAQIGALIAAGRVTAATLFFNNLTPRLGEWRTGWLQRVEDSWLGRYLPKAEVPS